MEPTKPIATDLTPYTTDTALTPAAVLDAAERLTGWLPNAIRSARGLSTAFVCSLPTRTNRLLFELHASLFCERVHRMSWPAPRHKYNLLMWSLHL